MKTPPLRRLGFWRSSRGREAAGLLRGFCQRLLYRKAKLIGTLGDDAAQPGLGVAYVRIPALLVADVTVVVFRDQVLGQRPPAIYREFGVHNRVVSQITGREVGAVPRQLERGFLHRRL